MKNFKTTLVISFFMVFLMTLWVYAAWDAEKYVLKGQFAAAEKYCEKQKDEKRVECYRLLAEACFKNNYYEKAGHYYKIIADNDGAKKSFTKAAETFFLDKEQVFSGHTDQVYSVAISPDSRYIISGGLDKTIKIWDRASGQLSKTFTGNNEGVGSVAISADSRYLVAGGRDGAVRIWNFASGKYLKGYTLHYSSIVSVAISTDNRYIVTGSTDNAIGLLELASGKYLKKLDGRNGSAESVAISADNRYILSGNADDTITIWDLASGKKLKTLTGHSGIVSSIAVSADNHYIVSGSWDKTTKLWDLASGELLKTFDEDKNTISSVAISTDNRLIVSATHTRIRILDLADGKVLKTFSPKAFWGITSIAITLDDRYIVAGGADNNVRCLPTQEIMSLLCYLKAGFSEAEAYGMTAGLILANAGDSLQAILAYQNAGNYYEIAGDKDGLTKVASFLLTNKDYAYAADYLLKAGIAKDDVYQTVAGEAFTKGIYAVAGNYYEKANYKEGLSKVASAFLAQKDYKKAAIYYEKAGNAEDLAKVGDAFLANEVLAENSYLEAIDYYKKAGYQPADVMKKMADSILLRKKNDAKFEIRDLLFKYLLTLNDPRLTDIYVTGLDNKDLEIKHNTATVLLGLKEPQLATLHAKITKILKDTTYIKAVTIYNPYKRPLLTTIYNVNNKPVASKTYIYSKTNTKIIEKVEIFNEITKAKIVSIDYDLYGEPKNSKWLCFDINGNLIMNKGKEVLINPFNAEQTMLSDYNYDSNTGLVISMITRIYPCKNALENTGINNCQYFW